MRAAQSCLTCLTSLTYPTCLTCLTCLTRPSCPTCPDSYFPHSSAIVCAAALGSAAAMIGRPTTR